MLHWTNPSRFLELVSTLWYCSSLLWKIANFIGVQISSYLSRCEWKIQRCAGKSHIVGLIFQYRGWNYIYISPCCGLCLRRVSLNLENLRPTHEQNTSFGNLDQHFFTIMSSKMVMFQKKTTNQLGPLQHPHPGMKLEVSTCSADPIDLWYNMAMRNPLKIGIWIGNLSTNGGCPMAMFDYQRAIGLWLGVS